MNISHYITEIEKKMTKLNINPDTDQAYNQIFAENDDNVMLRRLRKFNELLNKAIDDLNMDGV